MPPIKKKIKFLREKQLSKVFYRKQIFYIQKSFLFLLKDTILLRELLLAEDFSRYCHRPSIDIETSDFIRTVFSPNRKKNVFQSSIERMSFIFYIPNTLDNHFMERQDLYSQRTFHWIFL